MAWGTATALDASITVFTTEVFSSILSKSPGETIYFQFQSVVTSATTTTDRLRVKVYTCRENTTTSFDNNPIRVFDLANYAATNTVGYACDVESPYVRIGYIISGSTNTCTAYSWYVRNGVSI